MYSKCVCVVCVCASIDIGHPLNSYHPYLIQPSIDQSTIHQSIIDPSLSLSLCALCCVLVTLAADCEKSGICLPLSLSIYGRQQERVKHNYGLVPCNSDVIICFYWSGTGPVPATTFATSSSSSTAELASHWSSILLHLRTVKVALPNKEKPWKQKRNTKQPKAWIEMYIWNTCSWSALNRLTRTAEETHAGFTVFKAMMLCASMHMQVLW